jgi:hypothetical protein
MPSFWNPTTRAQICRRVERLTAEHTPRWGKMNAAQMLAHLNDAMRLAHGELATTPKATPLRHWPIKQLVVYVLPWPQGAPTAPELLARMGTAELGVEQAEFQGLADRLAAKSDTDRWPEHPAFGTLSHQAWGVLQFRHIDHHLRQFGL